MPIVKKNWIEVRGQEFTQAEAVDAADFADMIESYGVDIDDLKDFIDEGELRLGSRLALAELLPIGELGIVVMAEKDDRVMRVAKKRIEDDKLEKDGGIIVC